MLSKEQSFSISIIRSMSVLFIITCHILQGYGNLLAWWFNVGVQIFLFISGFLYGAKGISNYNYWIRKRLTRILKPYYIYLIVVLPILVVSCKIPAAYIIIYTLNLQGLTGGLESLGHLWYLTLIVLCYLIIPIVCKFNISNKTYSTLKFYVLLLFQIGIVQLLLKNCDALFKVGICIYIFGFNLSSRYGCEIPKKLKYLLGCVLILLLPIKIYFQYFYKVDEMTLPLRIIYDSFPWIHALLGIVLFMFLYDLLSGHIDLSRRNFFEEMVNLIDKYSYEIYITHHVYILGTFSLLRITDFKSLNILIILLSTSISAFILKRLSSIKIYQNHLVVYKRT